MLLLDEEECDVLVNPKNVKVRRFEVQNPRDELKVSSLSERHRTEIKNDSLVSPQLAVPTNSSSASLSFRAKGGNGLAKMDLLRYGAVHPHPSQPLSQKSESKTTAPLLNNSSFSLSSPLENPSASVVPSSFLSLSKSLEPCASSTALLSPSPRGELPKTPAIIYEHSRTVSSSEASPCASFSPSFQSFSDEASLEILSQKKNSSGSDVSASPSISSPPSQEISLAAKRPGQSRPVYNPFSVTSSPPPVKQTKLSDFFFVKK